MITEAQPIGYIQAGDIVCDGLLYVRYMRISTPQAKILLCFVFFLRHLSTPMYE